MIGARGGTRERTGHPAEDVWIAAQLIERDDLGMVGRRDRVRKLRAVPRY